jgi:hypothetical protein
MFALFPSWNYTGFTNSWIQLWHKTTRVKESINISITYAAVVASIIFCYILFYATPIVTDDQAVLSETPNALRWVSQHRLS